MGYNAVGSWTGNEPHAAGCRNRACRIACVDPADGEPVIWREPNRSGHARSRFHNIGYTITGRLSHSCAASDESGSNGGLARAVTAFAKSEILKIRVEYILQGHQRYKSIKAQATARRWL